ncbi:hypothetical protein [Streptomyces sp. H27-C3]|uniref:hypothetical protein n=1 Tax=Streptomyces sp. H27-C3 TaxID=3046305 RepID=UPI0024BB2500|nr:hypothetical protein [Streptomyces sp. H27-C3]MDJ0460576.1 hypothetical protein [Streptomyces sp. H27-C3]
MGVAARLMGWQRRMGAVAGPLGASGEAAPTGPVMVELLIGGTWVDITPFVLTRDGGQNIAITRGRRDEGAATTEHASCSFQLNNRDGRYSPRNPTSPYYGQLGRNQQLRVSVANGDYKGYRFWGEISSWPQHWDTTGTDVWVEVEGAGILRRLNQGAVPAQSVIHDGITDPEISSLQAYWPCEDVDGSTTIASALINGSAMTFTGIPALATYAGFGASDPLPVLSASSALSGGVARYDDATASQIRLLCHIPAEGLSDGKVICAIDHIEATAGAVAFWELYYATTGNTLVLRAHDADGSVLGAELTHTLDVRGRRMRISVELEEDGTSMGRAIRITDLFTMSTDSVTDTAALSSVQRVTRVRFGPASRSVVGPIGTLGLPGVAVGHVTVQSVITAATDLGLRLSPSGEAAGRRIERLCAEAGIPFDAIGDLDDTPLMGGQDRLKPIDVMRQAELADGGMLFENLSVLGLGYRTRASLLNQAPALTMSYPNNELSSVPVPVDDDQLVRNKVTASLPSGTSATAELDEGSMSTADPPVGIGVYGEDVTLNLEDSSTLADQANWRLHLATVDEARFPQISVNLARQQFSFNPALKAQALSMRPGDRLLLTDLPAWIPPDDISQLVLGLSSETIDHFEHRITYVCAPESSWRVGVLDDPVLGRIDTDGSAIYVGATSSATSLYVTPTGDGGLWTTDSSDFPFDVRAGGETWAVTAIASTGADDFTRAVSNDWGTSSGGNTWTQAGGTATERNVNGAQGVITWASSPTTLRFQTLVSGLGDAEARMTVSPDQVATGASFLPAILLRYTDTSNYYRARLHFGTSGSMFLSVTRDTTQIGSTVTLDYTYAAGDAFYVRAKLVGQQIQLKAWPVAETEPKDWQLTETISANTIASGAVGITGSAFAGNTNVSPQLRHDDFHILDPQVFTVTRSVNGVNKAQTAGTDVRLAQPTILSL